MLSTGRFACGKLIQIKLDSIKFHVLHLIFDPESSGLTYNPVRLGGYAAGPT